MSKINFKNIILCLGFAVLVFVSTPNFVEAHYITYFGPSQNPIDGLRVDVSWSADSSVDKCLVEYSARSSGNNVYYDPLFGGWQNGYYGSGTAYIPDGVSSVTFQIKCVDVKGFANDHNDYSSFTVWRKIETDLGVNEE